MSGPLAALTLPIAVVHRGVRALGAEPSTWTSAATLGTLAAELGYGAAGLHASAREVTFVGDALPFGELLERAADAGPLFASAPAAPPTRFAALELPPGAERFWWALPVGGVLAGIAAGYVLGRMAR